MAGAVAVPRDVPRLARVYGTLFSPYQDQARQGRVLQTEGGQGDGEDANASQGKLAWIKMRGAVRYEAIRLAGKTGEGGMAAEASGKGSTRN